MTRNKESLALGIIRIVTGGVFVAHGLQKLTVFGLGGLTGFLTQQGLPFPAVAAALLIAAEVGAGAALVLGLFSRLAALPLAFTMLVALTTVHLKGGFFLPAGFEYVLVLLTITLGVAIGGPGAFAVDHVIARGARHEDALPLRRAA